MTKFIGWGAVDVQCSSRNPSSSSNSDIFFCFSAIKKRPLTNIFYNAAQANYL